MKNGQKYFFENVFVFEKWGRKTKFEKPWSKRPVDFVVRKWIIIVVRMT